MDHHYEIRTVEIHYIHAHAASIFLIGVLDHQYEIRTVEIHCMCTCCNNFSNCNLRDIVNFVKLICFFVMNKYHTLSRTNRSLQQAHAFLLSYCQMNVAHTNVKFPYIKCSKIYMVSIYVDLVQLALTKNATVENFRQFDEINDRFQ